MASEELNEITVDHVRSWLQKNPAQRITLDPGQHHRSYIAMLIGVIAAETCRTPQAIMREMNPRMMDRLPTGLEVMAHDGKWIITYDRQTEICVLGVNTSEYGEPATVLNFHNWEIVCSGHETGFQSWPCDQNINKVPWPQV